MNAQETYEHYMGETPQTAFPTITIPDPAAVGKWLDEQVPSKAGRQLPAFDGETWSVCHWFKGDDYVFARAETPEGLLEDIKLKVSFEPLAKLRKEAEAHGYALMKLPED